MSSIKKEFAASLKESLQITLSTGRSADVTVHVGEQTFRCHKVILSAMSPFFYAMFSHDMREGLDNVARLEETPPDAFNLVLKYMYLGEISVTEENVEDIFRVASMMLISCLQDECLCFIAGNLRECNIDVYRELAELYNNEVLKEMLDTFGNQMTTYRRYVGIPSHLQRTNLDKKYLETLLAGVKILHEHKEYTDLILNFGNKEYSCHNIIVRAIFPTVQSLLSVEPGLTILNMSNMSTEECTTFFAFIDTGEMAISEENVMTVYVMATHMGITYLKNSAEIQMESMLSTDNCIVFWQTARANSSKGLEERAFEHITTNFKSIYTTESFASLSMQEIITLIESDNLQTEEEVEALEAIYQWVRTNMELRKQFLPELLGAVRLPQLKHIFPSMGLWDRVPEFKMFNTECKQMIKEAIELRQRPDIWQTLSTRQVAPRFSSHMQNYMIVCGGPTSKANRFSFRDKDWSSVNNLPRCHSKGGFAVCSNGTEVVLSGGYDFPNKMLKLSGDVWMKCSPLTEKRAEHAMVYIGGDIYVLGGWVLARHGIKTPAMFLSKYNISQDTWIKYGRLAEAVVEMAVAALDGKIYIYGGTLPGALQATSGSWVQCFNVELKKCELTNPLPVPVVGGRAVVCDYSAFIVTPNGDVIQHQPTTNTYTILSKVITFDRKHFGLVQYRGNLLLVGGEATDGKTIQNMLLVNPTTGEILQQHSIPWEHVGYSCARAMLEIDSPYQDEQSMKTFSRFHRCFDDDDYYY